jgi:hypothetical protein
MVKGALTSIPAQETPIGKPPWACRLATTNGWNVDEFYAAVCVNDLGRGKSVRRLLLILLIALLGIESASAQCTNWVQFAGRADLRVVFQGTVGDRPVRMMLHLNKATGQEEKSLNVSLHVAGELNLANDAHRQLNDVAALKLRKAMLETFSSLLDYPLISEDRNHQQWFFG